MVTEIDEGRGLVKTTWQAVRKRVAIIEPRFAQIVDELDPDHTFPLYLAYYPYGALKGDTESTFLPNKDGSFYRLTDPNAPKEIVKQLGYGKDSAPLAMLLDKNLELFIDLKEEKLSIPKAIYTPGAIFPFARILSRKSPRVYAPNGVLTLTSGVRSTFLLPNIGCATLHGALQRDFNVSAAPPKTLYDQWSVFKDIAQSPLADCNWRACLMYFSHKWLDKFSKDPRWLPLKLYLHELGWQQSEFQRNHFYYDVIFSMLQKKRNLKPNPYLVDTARHLFTIAMGAAPGYQPLINDEALPLNTLQNAFIQSYGLKKYLPTLIGPASYQFEKNALPIYYSLQQPSSYVFSPKSRKIASTISQLRELQHIMRAFISELAKPNALCSDTFINTIANQAQFTYYHNELDRHKIIRPSAELGKLDRRLQSTSVGCGQFASDARFLRGCISIKRLTQR